MHFSSFYGFFSIIQLAELEEYGVLKDGTNTCRSGSEPLTKTKLEDSQKKNVNHPHMAPLGDSAILQVPDKGWSVLLQAVG